MLKTEVRFGKEVTVEQSVLHVYAVVWVSFKPVDKYKGKQFN